MVTPQYESTKTVDSSSVRRKLTPINGYSRGEAENHPSDSHDIFKDGDKVMHTIFGEGRIVSVKPSGNDLELTVAFEEGHGVKKLLNSIAPVKKM